MVTLLEGGAYLVNGTQIIPDNQDAAARIAAETGSGKGNNCLRHPGKPQHFR